MKEVAVLRVDWGDQCDIFPVLHRQPPKASSDFLGELEAPFPMQGLERHSPEAQDGGGVSEGRVMLQGAIIE